MATAKPKTTPRPAHFAELCPECGHSAGPVPEGATSFACEHGTWKLASAEPAAEPAESTADTAQE